ncbi:hypothetical protein D7Y13_26420 [Corallococcus praedator]|uniref:Uncharacterized protein n=1 Tax=Corallococcus praedator TaxID=2316724 RepID=A0ABX9QBX7_9BACT|nr:MULTISPECIES: putative metal-binding motif-containing protein [Corallococcus]RKH24290.1 hypothetical protein D7X75_32265 [Corallococcus sp. CA031C]RKI00771.1 hypothetical protein D7Y13_26420 [Corallococcus praedator]
MRHLLLLLPLFALAGCKDPQDGVKVTVTSTGFVPGCLRVTARDDASQETRSTALAGKGAPSVGGSVLVGVVLPEDWGTGLTLKAEAFEAPFVTDQDCTGKVVASGEGPVTIVRGEAAKGNPPELKLALSAADQDGDGYILKNADGTGGTDCDDDRETGASVHPGATERCNDRDDDCSGDDDQTFFGLGVACTQDGGCTGKLECAFNKVGTTCNAPTPTLAWVDGDDDKVGKAGVEPTPFCAPNTVPDAGFVPFNARHDDCDDGNKKVNPLEAETCDGVDNNCDGTTDILTSTCDTPDTHCAGLMACTGRTEGKVDGGTFCMGTAAPSNWSRDEDLDNHGSDEAQVIVSCIRPDADYAPQAGDCDDGNPFIHEGAPELCDSQDNDCNPMTTEAGVCPAGGPTWATQDVGTDPSRDWLGVSVYGNGGVWIVGTGSGRAVKVPTLNAFKVLDGACTDGSTPQILPSVWADPSTDTAYIGRDEGQLIVQTPTSTDCTPRTPVTPNTTTTTGLKGFATNGGGVKLFGTGKQGATTHGVTFQWNGGGSTVNAQGRNNLVLSAVHGISESTLFAVGVENDGKGAVLRYTGNQPPPADWVKDTSVPNAASALTAVHVVNAKLAYAVSDSGQLLQWNGTEWSIDSSGAPPGSYTGVLAFGKNAIFISTLGGTVLRYDGSVWDTSTASNPKHGIAGTSPADIWVVGQDRQVTHYPFWPQ